MRERSRYPWRRVLGFDHTTSGIHGDANAADLLAATDGTTLIGGRGLGDLGRTQTLDACAIAGEPIDLVVQTYDAPSGADTLRYRMSVAGEPLPGLGLQLFGDGFEP